MRIFLIALISILSFNSKSNEVKFLEKKEYDYCPISQVCSLVIEHYLTDQTTRQLFMTDVDRVLTERKQINKGYRLDGNLFLSSNYNFRSTENVITFYDGVGLASSAKETELINTYNAAIRYDLEPASIKKNRVNNSVMQRSLLMKDKLFQSINILFPAFSRIAEGKNRRNFFGLVASVLAISSLRLSPPDNTIDLDFLT